MMYADFRVNIFGSFRDL